MSDIDVQAYIGQLRAKLPYVPPLPTEAIQALHNNQDFGGVVQLIRKTMNVGVNLTVHWTGTPPPKELQGARAWIELPEKMPYYGTPEFKRLKMDIFILKSFRDASSPDEFTMAVAHELSHVVLESIEHPLRKEEKAVDLTAMLLGFSRVYQNSAHTIRQVAPNRLERRQLGYLSETEIEHACRILIPTRMRARRAVLKWAEQNATRLMLLASCAAIAAAILISNEWDKHQLASAQAAQIRSEAPRRLSSLVTLTGAHAGLASVTREFLVSLPKDKLGDFSAMESNLRSTACAGEGANIREGLSYIYDYHDPNGERVARFEISSCP